MFYTYRCILPACLRTVTVRIPDRLRREPVPEFVEHACPACGRAMFRCEN